MKKKYRIITNEKPAIDIYVAGSFLERLRGLLGTKKLSKHTGLLLVNCNAIHMFFMAYGLDIVYVDEDFRVVKIVENLKPWQISGCRKAKHTIELPVGIVEEYSLKVANKIVIQKEHQ